jgi:hypothetical protein
LGFHELVTLPLHVTQRNERSGSHSGLGWSGRQRFSGIHFEACMSIGGNNVSQWEQNKEIKKLDLPRISRILGISLFIILWFLELFLEF